MILLYFSIVYLISEKRFYAIQRKNQLYYRTFRIHKITKFNWFIKIFYFKLIKQNFDSLYIFFYPILIYIWKIYLLYLLFVSLFYKSLFYLVDCRHFKLSIVKIFILQNPIFSKPIWWALFFILQNLIINFWVESLLPFRSFLV